MMCGDGKTSGAASGKSVPLGDRLRAAWRMLRTGGGVPAAAPPAPFAAAIGRRTLLTGSGAAFALGAFLAEALGPREAQAAMTVFDPSNLAKNAETAAQTAQLVLSNKGILEAADSTLRKIGLGGVSSNMADTLFSAVGGARKALGQARRLQGSGRLLTRAMQGGASPAGTGGMQSVTDGISTAQRFMAMSSQAAGTIGDDNRAFQRQRMQVVRSAQAETLGAAMFHSQDASETGDRVAALADAARSAAGAEGDLRSQIAVLNSSVLMLVEEAAKTRQLNAALAAQLAVEGEGQLNSIAPRGGAWSDPGDTPDGAAGPAPSGGAGALFEGVGGR